MDNALAQPLPAAVIVPPGSGPSTGVVARWQTLPGRTQVWAVIGLVGLLVLLVVMFSGARDSDYRVLFPSLSEKDGGQVIERLAQMNVPYRLLDGSGSILVPGSRVHELRMKLAAAGLPAAGGASGGYELLDKNSFGQTQGQERMQIQRAIEGELTTTIQALESVKSARVHLAMPNQNGFFREQQKPSASVVLTLHPGRSLDRSQIAGIVHLVSGSIPEMSAKAVSVIDSTGALLSGAGDDTAQGLDSQQLQYRRELESNLLRRVLDLLEPVVGRDNVRASISADIDFSQVLQTAETWNPNQGDQARVAIREQRSEDSSQPAPLGVGGIPGAATNQPPVPATAPINGPAQALQGAAGAAPGAAQRRETAVRYEVDKTTTVTRNAAGSIQRLSAAVVVNHRVNTDARGRTTSTPLSPQEIEQLTSLVQQGIGFRDDRGDIVRVVNAPFRVEPTPAVEEIPLWQQPWLLDLLRTLAAPLALALLGLIIVFKLIKPAVTVLMAPPPPPPPGTQLSEVVDGDVEPKPPRPALKALQAPDSSDKLEAVRALAKNNPAAVAHIVRGWVSGAEAT